VPSQAYSHRGLAGAGVDQVWSALQRPDSWRQIGGVTAITNPRFDELGLIGYDFTIHAGGRDYRGEAERSEAHPGQRMAMAIESELLEGLITVELTSADPGTGVALKMEMSSRGFMAGLLFGVISAAVANGFNETAQRFIDSLTRDPGSETTQDDSSSP
jgi:hypothetical protein